MDREYDRHDRSLSQSSEFVKLVLPADGGEQGVLLVRSLEKTRVQPKVLTRLWNSESSSIPSIALTERTASIQRKDMVQTMAWTTVRISECSSIARMVLTN